MILVAGGTGTLGTKIVSLLLAGGDRVRVLTRDEARATELRSRGVEAIVGDLRDQAAVDTAAHGCATVVMAAHGFVGGRGAGPAEVDRDGNRRMIRAAVAANASHAILMSTRGAAGDSPMSLDRMKYAAEQALVGSGLHWTIVRSGPFLETWSGIIGAHVADRGRALVLGPGDNPINFVSVDDVAALINRSVRDAGLRGRILDAIGPENLTFTDLAAADHRERATRANRSHSAHRAAGDVRAGRTLHSRLRTPGASGRADEHHRHVGQLARSRSQHDL